MNNNHETARHDGLYMNVRNHSGMFRTDSMINPIQWNGYIIWNELPATSYTLGIKQKALNQKVERQGSYDSLSVQSSLA
jgi:hypothetical protein